MTAACRRPTAAEWCSSNRTTPRRSPGVSARRLPADPSRPPPDRTPRGGSPSSSPSTRYWRCSPNRSRSHRRPSSGNSRNRSWPRRPTPRARRAWTARSSTRRRRRTHTWTTRDALSGLVSGLWFRDVGPRVENALGEPVRGGRAGADSLDQHAGLLIAVHALRGGAQDRDDGALMRFGYASERRDVWTLLGMGHRVSLDQL